MKSGMTLIELLAVLAIASVLMWVASTPISNLHKLIWSQQQQLQLDVTHQRFHLIIKQEWMQSGWGITVPSQASLSYEDGVLSFYADHNEDGDLEDKRESIRYRFQPSTQTIDRKSGGGGFHKFLEQIQSSEVALRGVSPSGKPCIHWKIQRVHQSRPEEHWFCS